MCAKQTANRQNVCKTNSKSKSFKSYIHCVCHLGNDYLNYVWHSQKVKMRKTNSNSKSFKTL